MTMHPPPPPQMIIHSTSIFDSLEIFRLGQRNQRDYPLFATFGPNFSLPFGRSGSFRRRIRTRGTGRIFDYRESRPVGKNELRRSGETRPIHSESDISCEAFTGSKRF